MASWRALGTSLAGRRMRKLRVAVGSLHGAVVRTRPGGRFSPVLPCYRLPRVIRPPSHRHRPITFGLRIMRQAACAVSPDWGPGGPAVPKRRDSPDGRVPFPSLHYMAASGADLRRLVPRRRHEHADVGVCHDTHGTLVRLEADLLLELRELHALGGLHALPARTRPPISYRAWGVAGQPRTASRRRNHVHGSRSVLVDAGGPVHSP